MPRSVTGVYTVPAGINPVVAGTTILDTWANPTLADVAQGITDSLDRSGRGSMLAQLKLVDGTAGTPGLGFANETSSGLYRVGAGVLGLSIATAEVGRWSAGQYSLVLGAVGAPSYSFTGDLNTGMWSPAADTIAWSVNGAESFRLSAAGGRFAGEVALSGSDFVYSWAGGTTGQRRAGFYLDGTNQVVRVYTALAEVARFDASGNFVVGGTAAVLASANRGNITVNGVTDSVLALSIGGAYSAYFYTNAAGAELDAQGARYIKLNTNGSERMRVDANGNVIVGGTSSQFNFANRGVVEINGTSQSLLGLDFGGAAKGYVLADSTSVRLVTTAAGGLPIQLGTGDNAKTLTLDVQGRFSGNSLHNNASLPSGTTNQYIASGTYTPTVTNVSNIAASSGNICSWIRVGNVVLVAGTITVSTTATATNSQLNITLPIGTTHSGNSCAGAGSRYPNSTVARESVTIQASGTTNADMQFLSSNNTSGVLSFTLAYEVR